MVLDELNGVRNLISSMIRDNDVPIGLVNPHNTCYLNSLLQCLYQLPPFRKLM